MQLTAAETPALRPLVIQATEQPVIVDGGSGGEDACCPDCGQLVMINVAAEGVYDLAVECHGCKRILHTPALPRGRGLGAMRIVIPSGRHVATDSLFVDHDEVVIGAPGAERRTRETGFDEDPTVKRITLDRDGLASICDEARELFAPILRAVEGKYRRTPSPSYRSHRLPELVLRLEDNLRAVEAGGVEIDVISAIELQGATATFRRWRHDPEFTKLLQASRSPTAYPHNFVVLNVATVLDRAGMGPELVPTIPGVPTPDIRLRISARRSVDVEVKSLESLQRRVGIPVPERDARWGIERALRSSRAQRRSGAPFLLVVGGLYWEGDIEDHTAAAADALSGAPRPSLAGLILVSSGLQSVRARGQGVFGEAWDEFDWSRSLDLRWVANPTYSSDLQISFSADFSQFDLSFKP